MNPPKEMPPRGSDDMEAVESAISQELLKISYNDRNAINEEIHGVRCLAAEESPDLLRMSLESFRDQLNAMPPSKKKTYNEILRRKHQWEADKMQIEISSMDVEEVTSMHIDRESQANHNNENNGEPYSFIDDENFRLRFLRCELFDAEKAVLRFVNYLDLAYELFGTVALRRVVRIGDFSKSDLRFVKKGFYQILPYPDRAGRQVMVLMGGMDPEFDPIVRAKCFFYLRDAVTRDSVESQQKGVVFVADVSMFMTSEGIRPFDFSNQTYAMTKRVVAAVPTRVVAMHTCWPDTPGFRIFNILNIISRSSSNYVLRVRSQVGKPVHMRYRLKGYGIPIHLLPLTETGAIKMKYFYEWLRIRKTLEEASEEEFAAKNGLLRRVVTCPGLADVVFRQGTPSMKNPGNVVFRDTMIAHLEAHHDDEMKEGHQKHAKRIEDFCKWLIETTETTKGGRFLEWDKNLNVWVEMIDREIIKKKVAIAYRDTSKRFRNHRKQVMLLDSTDVVTPREHGSDEGSYAFVEGGNKKEKCCETFSRYVPQTINGVPMRSDSNYNETSGWL